MKRTVVILAGVAVVLLIRYIRLNPDNENNKTDDSNIVSEFLGEVRQDMEDSLNSYLSELVGEVFDPVNQLIDDCLR